MADVICKPRLAATFLDDPGSGLTTPRHKPTTTHRAFSYDAEEEYEKLFNPYNNPPLPNKNIMEMELNECETYDHHECKGAITCYYNDVKTVMVCTCECHKFVQGITSLCLSKEHGECTYANCMCACHNV